MRASLAWLGGLLLLAVCARGSTGSSVLAPQDKAAEPTAARQKLLDTASQLNAEGMGYYLSGDIARARLSFQEALALRRQAYPRAELPKGHPDLASSLNRLGLLHQAAGDYAQAEPLLREALAMYHALYPKEAFPDGHPDLAGSLSNLGRLHLAMGEHAKTEPLYREALAMRRALYPRERFPAGHPDLAASLNNLGRLHQAAGEYVRAEPLFRKALAMRRALYPRDRYPNGDRDLAISINNLGDVYDEVGERGKAESLYREALAMRRALYPPERFPAGHPDLAQSISNLGKLHQGAGEYAKAEPLFREALAMRRALYPPERFPLGHPDLARSLNNLGVLHQAAGEYATAEPLLGEALAMRRALYPKQRLPAGHPDLARTLNNLGALHRAAGHYARAEPFYREALAMCRALYPKERFPAGHPDLVRGLHNLGVLHHFAGQHARAAPLYREALAINGKLVRQFADLAAEAESGNFAETQPLTRDFLLSNSRHLPKSAAAYEALWDGRALLTRVQERRHRDLLASADRATAALAAELRQTRRSLARLLLSPARDASAHRQAVQQLTQTKENLEKRIAAKLQLATLKPAMTVTTVQQLGETLPAGAAFVDLLRYFYLERDPKPPGIKGVKLTASYVAFVVGKGRPLARVELHEAAPIEKAWAAWHKLLLAPASDQKAERAAARAFATLIWEPIGAALPANCQTVYLTPDGVLTQVPWAALPGQKRDSVLLDEHAICLVPHGPWLLEHLQEKPAPHTGTSLVAYGGIDYEGAPAAVAKGRGPRDPELVGEAAVPVSAEKRLHWAALPGTAREQEQIVALARKALKEPPIVRSGRAASTEQLLEDLPQARYAHLATHGFFADPHFRSYLQVDPKLYEYQGLGERRSAGSRSPLVLSGLVLAGANRQGKDAAPDHGIITAEGLIGLRLEDLELAVLSACETSLGEVAGGEGVFGLQRAFHLAGTRSVVASLWKIDDAATLALMAEFYRNLWERKLPKLEALRRAQLAMLLHYDAKAGQLRAPGAAVPVDPSELAAARAKLRSAGRPLLPPLYWAGFVLSGDWR
jgi:CHAT domain-containing protein